MLETYTECVILGTTSLFLIVNHILTNNKRFCLWICLIYIGRQSFLLPGQTTKNLKSKKCWAFYLPSYESGRHKFLSSSAKMSFNNFDCLFKYSFTPNLFWIFCLFQLFGTRVNILIFSFLWWHHVFLQVQIFSIYLGFVFQLACLISSIFLLISHPILRLSGKRTRLQAQAVFKLFLSSDVGWKKLLSLELWLA